eukprot:6123373-Pyramimonas_sp.AAC.1
MEGAVSRIRSFYKAGVGSSVESIRRGCEACFSIISPGQVEYGQLSAAMTAVVSDRRGPYLKPLTSGSAANAILAKAVATLEKREAER